MDASDPLPHYFKVHVSNLTSNSMVKVNTVEEQVRASAEHKLGVANQSITAGFFDNNTSAEDRKEYLESLLRESKNEEDAPVLDDDALNDLIIARGNLVEALAGNTGDTVPKAPILQGPGGGSWKVSVIWFSLLLLLALGSASAVTDVCQQKCGDVYIPYPFGIGKNCFLSKFHEVQCKRNQKSGELRPFLPRINKTVLEISLPRQDMVIPYGSIRVEAQTTSTGCSGVVGKSKVWVQGDGKEVDKLLNLTGTPFTLGSSNSLVAIGCNTKALLTNLGPRVVGCISSCKPKRSMDRGRCNGYQCCRVETPKTIGHVIGVSLEGADGNTSSGGCKVAFLTDRYASSSFSNPSWYYSRRNYTTSVQLRWSVHSLNVSSFGCFEHSHSPCKCQKLKGFEDGYSTCACSKGYTGNPYILGGCKDMDECQMLNDDGSVKYCGGGTCVNTQGEYYCVFKKKKTIPIVIGVCTSLGVLLVVGLSLWLYVFIKKQREINQRQRFFKRNGGLLLQQQLHSNAGSLERTIIFTSSELDRATDCFSSNRVLGQGGQGTVYKGMLLDGRIVAVKRSKAVDENNLAQFINELVILSQMNHRNIVKVLGCCLENEVPILVYEFVPNGDLANLLRHGAADDSLWESRLCIAADVAGALSYMHSDASVKIYHRDIKSSNIMLDQNHRAKLSDFGISRSVTIANSHLTTGVAGTFGYFDPEYFQTGQYTEKSDVYSFGVVLVELITGGKMVRDFSLAVKEDRVVEVIDSKMQDNHNVVQVKAAGRLARRCVRRKGAKRPTMRQVSVELERIRSPQFVAAPPQPLVSESDEEEEGLQFDIVSSDSTPLSTQFQSATSSFAIEVEPPFLLPTPERR